MLDSYIDECMVSIININTWHQIKNLLMDNFNIVLSIKYWYITISRYIKTSLRSTQIIIWADTILNHIDTKTIPPRGTKILTWYTSTQTVSKSTLKNPSHSHIKKKKDEILIIEDDRLHVSTSGGLYKNHGNNTWVHLAMKQSTTMTPDRENSPTSWCSEWREAKLRCVDFHIKFHQLLNFFFGVFEFWVEGASVDIILRKFPAFHATIYLSLLQSSHASRLSAKSGFLPATSWQGRWGPSNCWVRERERVLVVVVDHPN